MRASVALVLCCITSTVFAAPSVQRIEASYDVSTRGIKIAVVTEKFVRTGNHYRIESLTKPVGLLALFKPDTLDIVSEGDVTAQGLRPQNFDYKRSKETVKNATARFDWDQSSITLDYNDGRYFYDLPADTQDRLSALYQFRYLPSLPERKDLIMHITDGRKISTRQYLIHPGKMLTVPMGKFETLYLSTPPEKTKWKTEIWLSVKDGNFPCKILVTEENGDQLTQVLTALSIIQ